jgi:hypothetical protein
VLEKIEVNKIPNHGWVLEKIEVNKIPNDRLDSLIQKK